MLRTKEGIFLQLHTIRYTQSEFGKEELPMIEEENDITKIQSTVINGDSLNVLKKIPSEFVRTVITSPPYWSLRDYDMPGQIGSEENVDDYIDALVEIFEQVYRVLARDGTLWLNIGDSYTSGNRTWRAPDKKNPVRAMSYRPPTPQGLKPKELVGIPWRLAFALQAAGWYLRSDIIWRKPNAMPESVKDRPTHSHEYIFLLTKSEKYYYNNAAVRDINNTNMRSVWDINTQSFSAAHFATFPPKLVERCLLLSTKPDDIVCDPFLGAGTVGMVAVRQGRAFLGIELNPDYIEIAKDRLQINELDCRVENVG